MKYGSLESTRLAFAERIRERAGLGSSPLVHALAMVPREDFIGPGPWRIVRPEKLRDGYELTPDDDPRRLYDNVLVALDEGRRLNNGEPAALLKWLVCPAPLYPYGVRECPRDARRAYERKPVHGKVVLTLVA